jgi:hypothetical protein
LYVHEGSTSGPVIAGARVVGKDGANSSFDQTTNASGCVTITGKPGTWGFTATKDSYQPNSWTQDISSTCTKQAFLPKPSPTPPRLPNQPTPAAPSVTSPQKPAPPTLVSPASSAANVPSATVFQWTGVPNADYYGLYVSKAPYGEGNLVYQQEGIKGTTVTLPAGKLQAGVTYRWNMRSYNNVGWGSFSESRAFTTAGTIGPPASDNPPSVTSFSASASAVQKGETITLSYSVADDVGLTRVELWRADDTAGADFKEITKNPISGKQYSGSFSDVAPSPGTYRYALHVVDSSNKWNDEKNSQSGALPGVYGPRQVVVAPTPAAPSVTNPPKPPAPTPIAPGLNSEPGQPVDAVAPLTFQWTAVPGADYYALAISESPYGPDSVRYRAEKINGTSHTVPTGTLKPSCNYFYCHRFILIRRDEAGAGTGPYGRASGRFALVRCGPAQC